MKNKLAFLSMLFLLVAGSLKSQDDPPPNPGLVISIVSGYSIEFVFDEIDDFINGIPNSGQNTFIRIGAIYDWKLQFKADQLIFTGNNDPASHLMELNNVGVVVTSIGTNLDDGSNIINNATVAVALESDDVSLLTRGALTNKGYGDKNSFILQWEMGTRNGNMNQTRMLDQMLAADSYTLNIILTLSVY